MLRLRHVGARIPSTQSGYTSPNWRDDNWEIMDSWEDSDGDWYRGTHIFGKGIYRPSYGIVFDYDPDHWIGNENLATRTWVWNGPGNALYYDEIGGENEMGSQNWGFVFPFNNTLDTLFGSWWQGIADDPPGTWDERRLLFFTPDSPSDTEPWNLAGNLGTCPLSWWATNGTSGGWPRFTQLYTSNFFMVVPTFTEYYYHENPWPDPPSGNLVFGSLYMFKAPNSWINLGQRPYYDGQYWEEFHDPENSAFDWKNDCSSLTYDMTQVYVKKKSDGTIWRYRNIDSENPFLIQERPIEPVPGVTYANQVLGSPPVAPGNTWDSLIVLR